MVDMAKAEEKLRGASDLMLELQQHLVEAQPQPHPRPFVQPHVAPSTLPREDFPFPQEASAYEEKTSISAPPARQSTSAWEDEPETLPAGTLGLETRGGGVVAGPSPGAPRGADCEWQRERGKVGAVEAGGDGELRMEASHLCHAGRTKGYIAAAAATETAPSPRLGPFLPLSIEVRTLP